MKRIILLTIALLAVAICGEARRNPGDKVGAAVDTISYHFGTVADDAPAVTHDFVITNTGTHALAILNVKPNCGCTAGDYSRQPIRPGKSTPITIRFNPRGQRGEVNKTVKVRLKNGAGQSEDINLRISGTVIPSKCQE